MFELLFIPPLFILVFSFFNTQKTKKILPFISALILIPALMLLFQQEKFYWHQYIHIDSLAKYILLLSYIVGIGVTLALESLQKHVSISIQEYKRFYRFFATFWIGMILSITANSMGLFWVGLELATLSTVYMIKTNHTQFASKEAWNYMIVGTIAISLILFGIILIYAAAKPVLGEEAMLFTQLQSAIHTMNAPYLFEIGFAFVAVGSFIKMGFFPMNLWLANIERASHYPVAALFSGILESAIMTGFFRFSLLAKSINESHLIGFTYIYALFTLFIVAFLIYRVKDFMRLFSLSGIEHMVLIAIFWVSGGYFAALLHFGAHALLKPALFISTGILESKGKYHIAGALRGFQGYKGKLFALLVALFILAIIALPPSPIFFSEIFGFSAMVEMAKKSHHLLLMFTAITFMLFLLAIIFYKFVDIYQQMKYSGSEEEKNVYSSDIAALIIFAVAVMILLANFKTLQTIV
ncbi:MULTISPECIES: proton-conducting transporter membrane subunit [unclassified Nitratiruptor]|uniref:proton-conducting transporter transmembrane domain-containing protein n=1 Tax=unclassified Nitratiruptor TaxID=2624044 RepID=UPI0019166AC8|nr:MULTISPECIES: proton-conducting transporter membrane subunit [unclassified Nitratiruptor]BCD60019.1 hydrogenase-4 component F [Nitratiruptor sp. YY08-10]BCD63942.1 hydrogenase-4 component F [Nitratiruptor sp. YY08-14]